jgi:hypothetical protein
MPSLEVAVSGWHKFAKNVEKEFEADKAARAAKANQVKGRRLRDFHNPIQRHVEACRGGGRLSMFYGKLCLKPAPVVYSLY